MTPRAKSWSARAPHRSEFPTNSHQAVAVAAVRRVSGRRAKGVELFLPPVQTGGRVAASVSEAPEGGDTLLATGVNRWSASLSPRSKPPKRGDTLYSRTAGAVARRVSPPSGA